MTGQEAERNDFTKGSTAGSIVRLSLPMILAQLVNVLYNIVDRMYLGHMPGDGRLALTGVGVAFPIITIINAFANLCGSGGVPLILLLPHLWNLGIYGVLLAEPVTNVAGGLACYLTMLVVVWRKL